MTKHLFHLILFFQLWSCSSSQSWKEHFKKAEVSKREIQTISEQESGAWIQNQNNFIKMLFEQSKDPYYGVPKWTEQCLKENKIGKINKSANAIWAVSELYLKNGAPGHCSNSSASKKFTVIFLYCKEMSKLFEIKIPWKPELENIDDSICGDLLKN